MKDDSKISAIDQRFARVRQGDFVLAETSFLSDTGCRFPGMIVISQTCEIVRDYNQRPTVKVAALCEVSDASLQAIKRLRKPRYAYLSVLASQNRVVDLDFVMTLDKKSVPKWTSNAVAKALQS